jgi:hypothetical protein
MLIAGPAAAMADSPDSVRAAPVSWPGIAKHWRARFFLTLENLGGILLLVV